MNSRRAHLAIVLWSTLALGCSSARPRRHPPVVHGTTVRLAVRDDFGRPDTLVVPGRMLDSIVSLHPYLSAESLSVLDPDTAWERNLRTGERRFEGNCESCQDAFHAFGALSLSRRHPGLEDRRARMQSVLYELVGLFSCLDGGGNGHVHMSRRIPLLAEQALERGIRTNFASSWPRQRSDLEAWIPIARPDRVEDPDEPQTHAIHCLEGRRERFPGDPWTLEQAHALLDRF